MTVDQAGRVSEMDDDASGRARLVLGCRSEMCGEIVNLDQAERDEWHGLDVDAAADRGCERVC